MKASYIFMHNIYFISRCTINIIQHYSKIRCFTIYLYADANVKKAAGKSRCPFPAAFPSYNKTANSRSRQAA